MSARRRRTGRMKIGFDRIETIAATKLAENALAKAMGGTWKLTRHSALYRCKNGSYTLHLVWHAIGDQPLTTLTSTIRGIQLEASSP